MREESWNRFEEQERMENRKHSEPSDEYSFYEAVANGDIETVEQNFARGDFVNQEGKGKLSLNFLRNTKYHFVVTAALVTRFCIDAGMENEEAYTLSDFYILKMDECADIQSVVAVYTDMVMDFTRRMRVLKRPASLSKPVLKCINYIYENLTKQIKIDELAKVSDLSENYLSHLFKNEMGVSPADYIREQKIVYAKQMLLNSDYSVMQIADMLSFSSQSHFVQVFKNMVGLTPKKFREQKPEFLKNKKGTGYEKKD